MRTTQIIGLNDYAESYLKDKNKIYNQVIGKGMFDEDIYGGVWEEKIHENHTIRYIEEIQASPWSSGPMIFTHIKAVMLQHSDDTRHDMGYYFSWMIDPSIKAIEYDAKTGRYWV